MSWIVPVCQLFVSSHSTQDWKTEPFTAMHQAPPKTSFSFLNLGRSSLMHLIPMCMYVRAQGSSRPVKR